MVAFREDAATGYQSLALGVKHSLCAADRVFLGRQTIMSRVHPRQSFQGLLANTIKNSTLQQTRLRAGQLYTRAQQDLSAGDFGGCVQQEGSPASFHEVD